MKRLILFAMSIYFGLFLLFPVAGPCAETGLPEGLILKQTYAPGPGSPVGRIQQVTGRAVIMHQDKKFGYPVSKGTDLYKNDTIITLKDGRVSFKLNDGSFMMLSPETRLEINKSVFAPKQKTRSSFLSMAFGKARFVVQKIEDAKHSEFKVRTKTAVAGVRGSDFIILATAENTEITTLANTELEVISLAAPEAPPVVLHSYERTMVPIGRMPAAVHKVEARDVDRIMKEFMLPPSVTEKPVSMQSVPTPETEREAAATPVVVPPQDLVQPGQVEQELPQTVVPPSVDVVSQNVQQQQVQNIQKIQQDVNQTQTEINIQTQTGPLPQFPQAPVQ